MDFDSSLGAFSLTSCYIMSAKSGKFLFFKPFRNRWNSRNDFNFLPLSTYNNALRMLFGPSWRCSASGIYANACTDGFQAVMQKKAASLLARMRSSYSCTFWLSSSKSVGHVLCKSCESCQIIVNSVRFIAKRNQLQF